MIAAFLSMFLTLLFSIGSGQTAHLNVLAVPAPAAISKARHRHGLQRHLRYHDDFL